MGRRAGRLPARQPQGSNAGGLAETDGRKSRKERKGGSRADGKTRYDWVPEREGKLLAPEGSKSIQQQVVVRKHPHDVLRILFDGDRLYGRALEDTRMRYSERGRDE